MKKILAVLILVLAACGAGGGEPQNVPEIADILQLLEAEPPEPEILEVPEPEPEPSPEPSPEPPREPYFYFESGFLGVKFRVPNLPVWDFQTLNRASRNSALVGHWGAIGDDGPRQQQESIVFEIAIDTEHPRNWTQGFFGDEPFPGGRFSWVHPDEPDEVFTTAHGITVVQYSHTAPLWDWDDESPVYTTTMFIFRQDGRDYREIETRAPLLVATLNLPVEAHELFYPDARAVIDGLQFFEDAQIRSELTDEAVQIGITATNFPIIDGATSTLPLLRQILHTLFEDEEVAHDWGVEIRPRYEPWQASRTVPSYELLLAGEVDMILVPEPSAHVLTLAEDAEIELEFTPVASEALVFITATDNPVDDITLEQVRQIYIGMDITNWAELGGEDGQIVPLSRNLHSGSQTLMNNLVLRGEEIHPDLEEYALGAMSDMVFDAGHRHRWEDIHGPQDFALGYTVYFFLREMWEAEAVRETMDAEAGLEPPEPWARNVNPLAVNGVAPSVETINSGEYPLATRYYAVLRADTPEDAPARNIINWLLTPNGQNTVERAGLGRIGEQEE